MFRPIDNSNNIDIDKQNQTPTEIMLDGNSYDASIFGEGFVIENVYADLFKEYDVNNNGVLDADEATTFQNALRSATGDDNTLDDNELIQLFGKTNVPTEFSEKCGALFKALLICLKNGIGNTRRIDRDENICIESFSSDGSGVNIRYNSEDNIYVIRIYESGEDNERQLKELIAYTNADLRKDSFMGREGILATTHMKYENGRVVEQNYIHPGDTWTDPYTEYTKFEYDNAGCVSAKYNTRENKTTGETTYTATYYNGTRSEDPEYEQEEDRIVSKKIELTTVDGRTKREETTFDTDGITVLQKYIRTEKDDAVIVQEYSGANLENRIGHLPNRKIIYDKTGTIPQKILTNEFNKKGVLIRQTVEDKVNNTKRSYNFEKTNGKIENSYQGGIGDCYFLETLNSLNTNTLGTKLLNKTMEKTQVIDENGEQHTIYKVKFGGAEQIINDLTNGIKTFPRENIFIQQEYTITDEEFADAELRSGKDYSSGDKDVLIQELAYSKYRKDVFKTAQENGITFSLFSNESKLIAGLDIATSWGKSGDEIGDGGQLGLTMYLYTGIKSDAYFSQQQNVPVCKVGSDGNLSIVENSSSTWDTTLIKQESNSIENRYTEIDDTINILKNNSKKNGQFKTMVAEASIAVTTQIINGQKVEGGFHAFTVKGIKGNSVILINPWDSSQDITISLEDFKKATTKLVITDLAKLKK